MSKICIISMNSFDGDMITLVQVLKSVATKYGYGVYFGEPMPFGDGRSFHFDISDDFSYPNCERLLDNLQNEVDQTINTISYRARYIYAIITRCLQYGDDLCLYMCEDSGALESEYKHETVTEDNLLTKLMSTIQMSWLPPIAIHVVSVSRA